MLKVEEHIEKAIDRIYDLYHQANAGALELWKSDMVLSWHWWVGVGLFVLPWIFWAAVRKKESTHRLLLAGFVVLILSSFCDAVGTAMRLWDYNTQVIPLIPPYAPWDFTLLPVTAMLFYQFKPKWNPYLKAAVFAAIGSFVVQPVFEWVNFYEPYGWKDWYSFPLLFGIYLLGYYFVTRVRFEKL